MSASKRWCWSAEGKRKGSPQTGRCSRQPARRTPSLPKSIVTVHVTLDLQHSDVASLARQISGDLAEADREQWPVVLGQLKAIVESERPNCLACGARQKLNGRRGRVHHSLVGKISFERLRLRCTIGGRRAIILDSILAISPAHLRPTSRREHNRCRSSRRATAAWQPCPYCCR